MNTDKPKILDLFCCGGGAGMGYHLAGFEVVGVDIEPQPKYPFEFIRDDAISFLISHGNEFDAVHASPPCQAFTPATKQWRGEGREYNDFISATRKELIALGRPWVIENVVGAPLVDPVLLCGAMFGLKTYRHRLFESSHYLYVPAHLKHTIPQAKMGRAPKDGEFIQVVGHFSGVPFAQKAMNIGWLGQKELAQAIPPAYTEFIGLQLRALLMTRRAA